MQWSRSFSFSGFSAFGPTYFSFSPSKTVCCDILYLFLRIASPSPQRYPALLYNVPKSFPAAFCAPFYLPVSVCAAFKLTQISPVIKTCKCRPDGIWFLVPESRSALTPPAVHSLLPVPVLFSESHSSRRLLSDQKAQPASAPPLSASHKLSIQWPCPSPYSRHKTGIPTFASSGSRSPLPTRGLPGISTRPSSRFPGAAFWDWFPG